MNYSNSSSQNSEADVDDQFCYESVTGSCKRIVRPVILQLCMYFFMGCTIFVTVSGNFLVITSIAHFKQLHSTTNCLILSLAVCDFLLGAFIMPCSAMRSVQGCWFLGDFVCKLHSSTDIMLSTCSIFHLSFISLDRYFAICTPLLYQSINNLLTTLAMIAASWLIACTFSYGMIFTDLNLQGSELFYETQVKCVGGCTLFFSRTAAAVCNILMFFLPALVIVGIYSKIYFVARRQARSIKEQLQQIQTDDRHKSKVSGKTVRRKENSLAVVVGVYLFCWTPSFLCMFIDPFIGFLVPPTLFDALYWLSYMNSSFNPLIYGLFYSWFRKAFRIILSGRIFHRESSRTKLFSE